MLMLMLKKVTSTVIYDLYCSIYNLFCCCLVGTVERAGLADVYICVLTYRPEKINDNGLCVFLSILRCTLGRTATNEEAEELSRSMCDFVRENDNQQLGIRQLGMMSLGEHMSQSIAAKSIQRNLPQKEDVQLTTIEEYLAIVGERHDGAVAVYPELSIVGWGLASIVETVLEVYNGDGKLISRYEPLLEYNHSNEPARLQHVRNNHYDCYVPILEVPITPIQESTTSPIQPRGASPFTPIVTSNSQDNSQDNIQGIVTNPSTPSNAFFSQPHFQCCMVKCNQPAVCGEGTTSLLIHI